MMKFILPLIIVLLGLGVGGGVGYFLSPMPEPPSTDCVCEGGMAVDEHGAASDEHAAEGGDANGEGEGPAPFDYVNLKNQFVVPIVEERSVTGMMVMSLSIEVAPGSQEAVFAREPKLRDEFLRVLFAYATIGGFGGNFMEADDLKLVRADLTKAAKNVLGPIASEVLIVDMIRQDL